MASTDPFYAISGQRKKWDLEEFFASAKPHVDQFFFVAGSLGMPQRFERALEFGCGMGRILRHFEPRFQEVWGVDVSEEMIGLAKQYTTCCKFHLNQTADLSYFPDHHFDLVYSFLVLQHLPDKFLITCYVAEFIRILKPGGLAAFQIPDHLGLRWKIQPRRRAYHLLHFLGFRPSLLQAWNLMPMRLIAMPKNEVAQVITAAGGRIRQIESAGGNEGFMYYCTK
jgi:SAM-dependent methyltransferase